MSYLIVGSEDSKAKVLIRAVAKIRQRTSCVATVCCPGVILTDDRHPESLNSAHPNLQQNGKTVGCLVQLRVCRSTDQEGS